MSDKINSACQLNDKVVQMVKESEQFRAQLISDPKGALESAFNLIIPENIQVAVHVNNKDTINIEIPPPKKLELTDEELEKVAGGFMPGETAQPAPAYGFCPGIEQWQVH